MTITIPETSAELEELIADPAKVAQLMKDGQFVDAVKAYGKAAMAARDAELGRQLKEGLQLGLAEFLKENRGASVPRAALERSAELQMRGRRTSAERALYNRRADGAKAEGIFEDGDEFAQAVLMAGGRGRRNAALGDKMSRLAEVQNSFGSEIPADGGFLVPETLRSDLLQLSLEESIMRPRATVIPMSTLRVPIPTVDDTTHASTVFGGVQCYWTEEAAALTESQASFGRVVLDAKKLTAYAAVPNELIADAPAFQGFFDAAFPRAMAWFEDLAFFTGTGAGEPLGFINTPASVSVSAESGQATGTIVWENIVKMYARMLPTSLGRAIWIANIETFPQLATMALAVGTGGGPVWLGNVQNPGSSAPPMTILGRPVYFTEKAAALSTTGDVNFIDPSYYLIGDRQQMVASTSEHYAFANDKLAYRIIERVDGRAWLSTALTPHSGTATLSAFVQIATR